MPRAVRTKDGAVARFPGTVRRTRRASGSVSMMSAGRWIEGISGQSPVQAFLHSIYSFLIPTVREHATTLPQAALASLQNTAHSLAWFLLIGLLVYAASLRRAGRSGADRFDYAHPIREPGDRFSLGGAFRYLLPGSFYRTPHSGSTCCGCRSRSC